MKIPYSLIRKFVDTNLTARQAGDLLTMAGFELEELLEVAGEAILNIKVVPNRGDGLSALGLAREILAKDTQSKQTDLFEQATQGFKQNLNSEEDNPVKLEIQTKECRRYACKILKNVQNGPSPKWVQEVLIQAGMRPINLLVDLTNYLILELGQPMHAFDFDKIKDTTILVRNAQLGEKLITLNQIEHELKENQMMICNLKYPLAVAGIMGGFNTEVSDETKNILLESAHFEPSSIRKTRKELGISTEASYRYERWVDPEAVILGLNRFVQLYQEITGDHSAQISRTKEIYQNPYQNQTVDLRISRAEKLLGTPINPTEAKMYLEALGFQVCGQGEPFTVMAPTWRADIHREEDLIEEIARIHGYDQIPETLDRGMTLQGGVFGTYKQIDCIRDKMLRCGFDQVISHTLSSKHPLDHPLLKRVEIKNPHSPESKYLRTSLLPHIVESTQKSENKNMHLFEIGKTFWKANEEYYERTKLAILTSGNLVASSWKHQTPPAADFFSLKGVLQELFEEVSIEFNLMPSQGVDSRFHPTKSAEIYSDHQNHTLGIFGQIHPDLAEIFNLPHETYLAELDLKMLFSGGKVPHPLKEISRNPAVRRDIAILIDKTVPYAKIKEIIENTAPEILEKNWLFDIYQGKGIPEGKHSLAIGMLLRKTGNNLTDPEANEIRDKIVVSLETLGAELR